MDDSISRQAAIDVILSDKIDATSLKVMTALGDGRLALTLNSACDRHIKDIKKLPSVQPEQEDYTEMKREFIRMAEYIDVLLEVPDEEKETLMGFISRLAEFMPWTERD